MVTDIATPTTCNRRCVTARDIGLEEYGASIAYPHPCCPEHGVPHPFRWSGEVHDTHEGLLRFCKCSAYEDEHA